jgi:hypothetical protein
LIALAVIAADFSHALLLKFNAEAEFRVILRDLGINLASSTGGGSSGSRPGTRQKRWKFASRQNTRPLGEIATAYQARIESLLNLHDCQIQGRGQAFSGNMNNKYLTSFNYSYRRGATWGELAVEFADLSDGNFRVFVICNEFSHR